MNNQTIYSLFKVAFVRGLGALSLLMFTSAIAIKLDLQVAGEFFFSQAFFLVAVIICKWGSDFILCKNISLSLSENKTPNVKVIHYLLNIILLISIRSFFVIIFLELLDRYVLNGRLYGGFDYYIALFLNAIIVSLAGIFQAKGRINTYVVYQSVFIPLMSGVAVVVFPLTGVEDTWHIISLVSSFVMLVMLLHLNHVFQFDCLPRKNPFVYFDRKLCYLLNQQSGSIGADQIVTAANKFGFIVAIGLFIDPIEVTYFTVIQRFSMVISFVLIIVNATYSPIYAVMVYKGANVNLRKLFLKNNKLCLYAALLIMTVFMVVSGLLADFYNIPSQVFLYVFMLCGSAELVNVFTGSSGLLLQLAERSRFVFLSSLVFTSFGLVFSIFASLSESLLLVAFVYSTSLAAHNLNCYMQCRKYFKL